MRKHLTSKGWLALLIGIILLTDIAVLLDIAILRQISGVIFLAILPGSLILLLLKLNKLRLAERVVLTIGLSVAFLMIFGWGINQVCLLFGYTTPLSTNSLILSLSLAFTALLVAAYVGNKEAFSSSSFHFELNSRAKLLLLLPCIFPVLSIAGMHSLNTQNNNTILLALLFLIPVSIILISFFGHGASKNIYPIAIVMISLGLLLNFMLRSEHVLGHDVHAEYYFFHITQINSHWSILERSVLDACLAISLLPAVFQSLLNVEGAEYLFKGVYVLILVFAPLTVYVISKKFLKEPYAFLAALFFTFQAQFLAGPGSPRTNLAIFFFALFIMVLFHHEIRGVKQRGLLMVFMIAVIISHYSTTYIFFFLLLFTWLLGLILTKYVSSRNITFTLVSLFLALIFIWYAQLTEAPYYAMVRFFDETFRNLGMFFASESRAPEVATLFGEGIGQKIILSRINYIVIYATFTFIAVGVISTLIKRREMLSTPRAKNSPMGFLRMRFEAEYFLMALLCCGLLVAVVALPYISKEYGMTRIYSQVTVILSSFFVAGGVIISRYLRLNPQLLILLVLVPYFLFTTGTAYEASGVPTMLLSSEAPTSDYELVHEQDSRAAEWLKEHVEDNSRIYTADYYSRQKLVSQGKISPRLINRYAIFEHQEIPGYIYLSYNNVVNGKLVVRGEFYDMSEYLHLLEGKNRVYTNGGSEVYK